MPVIFRKIAPTSPTPDSPAVVPRLYTLKQAAAYLSTSLYAMRELIIRKKIPNLRIGKKYHIDRRDLDAFIEKEKHLGW
jgi:excisionase family DNA binding protein